MYKKFSLFGWFIFKRGEELCSPVCSLFMRGVAEQNINNPAWNQRTTHKNLIQWVCFEALHKPAAACGSLLENKCIRFVGGNSTWCRAMNYHLERGCEFQIKNKVQPLCCWLDIIHCKPPVKKTNYLKCFSCRRQHLKNANTFRLPWRHGLFS